jgi:prophage regulatory protein
MKKASLNYDVAAATLPTVGYARLPKICAVTGLGRSTIWAWVRQERFPKPIKLSSRASAWRVEDINEWLANPQAWQAPDNTNHGAHKYEAR